MSFPVRLHSMLLIGAMVLSSCLKQESEIRPAFNLCEENFSAFPSCSVFPSAGACSAVYGESCSFVALEDPLTKLSAVCSAHPLSENGCVGPLVVSPSVQDPSKWVENCSGSAVLEIADPSSLDFKESIEGTPDFSRTVLLKNNGTGSCPAVLGNMTSTNPSDFVVLPSSSCGDGKPLFAQSTCSITVILKSSSFGLKSGKLVVPFHHAGNPAVQKEFTLTATVVADPITITGPSSPGSELEWKFTPTVPVKIKNEMRCSFDNSMQASFFGKISVKSTSLLSFFATMSQVTPLSGDISFLGKKGSCTVAEWDNACFSSPGPKDPIEISTTDTDLYFKNTSRTIQSVLNPSRGLAHLAYRLKNGPADAPNKVRTISLRTFCY